MRGVFFVPPSIFKPPSSSADSFPKSARKNSASFLKKLPLFLSKTGTFLSTVPYFFLLGLNRRYLPTLFISRVFHLFSLLRHSSAKTPLIYHILSEKDEAKQDILQTFFIFASETYATIVVLLAAHLSSLYNRGIFPNELECSVGSPPHSWPAPASSMGIMCVSVISQTRHLAASAHLVCQASDYRPF